MNFNKLKFPFCLIAFTFLVSSNAQAECCPGLEYIIGFGVVVAGLPVLVGLIFLLSNLFELKKAVYYVAIIWSISLIIYAIIYFYFLLTEGSDFMEIVVEMLIYSFIPISSLLGFTILLYFFKGGIKNIIKAKHDYEGKV